MINERLCHLLSELRVVLIVVHSNVWHLHFLAAGVEAGVEGALRLRRDNRLSDRHWSSARSGSRVSSIVVDRGRWLRSGSSLRLVLVLVLGLGLILLLDLGLRERNSTESGSGIGQSRRLSSLLSSQSSPANEDEHSSCNRPDDDEYDDEREAAMVRLGREIGRILIAVLRKLALHDTDTLMQLAGDTAARAE